MAKKLPRVLRKEYSAKKFRRKLLSRVHTEKGKRMLSDHFHKGDDDVYRPSEAADEGQIKELSRLAKEIKKNRSAVRKGRVALVLIVIGGIVLFNLLLKNMLIERGAERGLEEAFRAGAEIDDLRFSVLDGSLTLSALRVADRQDPMENLFELGPVILRIRPVELLKGNVVIEEISGEALQFGTPREVSGALPRFNEASAQDTGGASTASGGSTAASTLSAGGILDLPDPREMVEESIASSESLAAIEALRTEISEAQAEWEAQVVALEEQSTEATGAVADLEAIDPSEIDSIEEARAAAAVIEEARQTIRGLSGEINNSATAAREDLQSLRDVDDRLADAVNADIDTLLGRLPGFEGGVQGMVVNLIQGYLQERLGSLYGHGERGLAIYRRLRAGGEDEPPRGLGRRGTVVSFPSAEYPRFYLQVARASVGNLSQGPFGEGAIEHISSDPGMITEAPQVSYSDQREGRTLAVQAVLPAVQGGEELAQVSVSLAGAGVQLPGDLSQGVFDRLSAEADAEIELEIGRGGRGRGTIDMLLRQPDFEGETPEDPIRRVLREAMAETESISFAGEFAFEDRRIVALNGSSNLTEVLSGSLSRLIADQRERFESRLREELSAALEDRLASLWEERGELSQVIGDLEDLVGRSESWNQVVVETEDEVERRVQELQAGATQQLQDEAERRGQDALDQIRNRF